MTSKPETVDNLLLRQITFLLAAVTASLVAYFVLLPELGISLRGTTNQPRSMGTSVISWTYVGLILALFIYLLRNLGATRRVALLFSGLVASLLTALTYWNGTLPLAVGSALSLVYIMLSVGRRFAMLAGIGWTLLLFVVQHFVSIGLHEHEVDARLFYAMAQLIWPMTTLIKAEQPAEQLKALLAKQFLISVGVFGILFWAVDPVWKDNAVVVALISLAVWFWLRKANTLGLQHRIALVGLPSVVYFLNVMTVNGLTLFLLPGYILLAYLCLPRLYAIALSVLYVGLGAVTLNLLDGLVVRGMVSALIFAVVMTLWFNHLDNRLPKDTSRRNLILAATLSLCMVIAGQLPLLLGILSYQTEADLSKALLLDTIIFLLIFWAVYEVLNYFDRERAARLEALTQIQKADRELKLATEAAALEREEQLRMLNLAVSVADISVYEVDLDSQETRLLSGDHKSINTGQSVPVASIMQMIPSISDREALAAALERDFSEVEYRIIYPGDREPRWSRIKTGSMYLHEGRRNKLLVRIDITSERESLEALRTAKERQREMFAVIGHELRTPVASIAMAVEDQELSDEQKLALAGDLSRSLLNVLEDLRTIVAPERALETQSEPAVPAEVARRATNALQPLAIQSGITLKLTIDPTSDQYFLFAVQPLRQIITNLAKNAIVHSQGESIWIALRVQPGINGKALGVLQVEDDGRGIPESERDQLFKAFSRGTTSADGSGLGLFIVSELAQLMSGTLDFKCRDGGGSVFTLEFPLDLPEISQESLERNSFAYDLKGKRILFAEDDATLNMLGEKLLTRAGAQVTPATNGEMALKCFAKADYDLVITDIMMPIIDGYALAKGLRERGFTGPIVGLTAAVVGKETEALIAAGADAVLSKPLKLDTIRSRLGTLFPEDQS